MAAGEYCGRQIVITVVPWITRTCGPCPLTSAAEVTKAISRFMDSALKAKVLKLSENRCITSVTITVCAMQADGVFGKIIAIGHDRNARSRTSLICLSSPSTFVSA